MLAITPRALDVEVVEPGGTRTVRIAVEPPIAPLDAVRARLVAMTKAARAALAGPAS